MRVDQSSSQRGQPSSRQSQRGSAQTSQRAGSGGTSTATRREKQDQAPTTRLHTYEVRTFWVEVELLGEDDSPIPGERYEITCPDGAVKKGKLDGHGWARVEGRGEGECTVCFPDLDQDAWEFIESTGPR